MKKEIIYIVLIVILLISIVGITILKITYSDYNINNNNSNANDNNLTNSSWIKERSEYHRDIDVKYQDELIENTYVEFKETSLEFCALNEKNEAECNEYNYSIKDNILTVYDLNNNEITYTYEVKNGDQLILVNDNEGSVWTNYYSKALG